jgi:CubicO group peptidase (beta-lactamase class C family)
VNLPEGSFLAEGAGGQYALVVPALDLVVVHRVDRDTPFAEPSIRSIGRLFWLILKAEGYDPGPDASLAAATGERLKGENLIAKIQGRTISFGAKRKDGPLAMRLGLDGGISYLHWDEAFGPATGTWSIVEDQLCITNVRRRCYIPVSDGDRIQLFDRLGVMQIDAIAAPP